jgi:arsenite methyltransferase
MSRSHLTSLGQAARTTAGLLSFALVLATASACTELKRYAYAPPDRDDWQQPARVLLELGLKAGDTVADIGAGGGYFTFKLADAVGKDGRVYAVDVDEAMSAALAKDAESTGYANVDVVVAATDDPGLAAGSIDLIFTSNTYHHIEGRDAYFKLAAKALAPGGRVAIVEFRENDGFFSKDHATQTSIIRSEMEAAGYRLLADHDFLERQAFLIFEVAE